MAQLLLSSRVTFGLGESVERLRAATRRTASAVLAQQATVGLVSQKRVRLLTCSYNATIKMRTKTTAVRWYVHGVAAATGWVGARHTPTGSSSAGDARQRRALRRRFGRLRGRAVRPCAVGQTLSAALRPRRADLTAALPFQA